MFYMYPSSFSITTQDGRQKVFLCGLLVTVTVYQLIMFLNLNITNIINITNPCLVCQLRGALVVIWNITFNLDVAAR